MDLSAVKAIAICEKCENFLESPITLPCSKTICEYHLKEFHKDYLTNKISCMFCKKQHLIPDGGFEVNIKIKNIIDSNAHLYEDEKRINLSFESSLQKLNHLLKELDKKEPEVQKHFHESLSKIKDQINLDVKSLKSQIDKVANKLFNRIKEFENECFKSLMKISRIENNRYDVEEINRNWNSQKRCPNFKSEKSDELKVCIDNKIEEIESKLKEFEKVKFSVERLIYKPSHTEINELFFGKLEVKYKKCKLITGSSDDSLKVWDMENAACIRTIRGHTSSIYSLTYSQSGLLISGSFDGTIKFWDMNGNYSCIKTIKEPYTVSSLAISETNDLISGFSDGTIKIWDLNTWMCIKVLKEHTATVVFLVPLPNNELISCSSFINIWNMNTSSCIRSLNNKSMVFCIAITKEYNLISGSENGVIKVWDVYTGNVISVFNGHDDYILSLEISKNDELFSGDGKGIIKIWNLKTSECLRVLEKHTSKIASLKLIDNNQLISCSGDSTIVVWNLNSYECVRTLEGHEAAIQCSTLITDQ